MKLVVLISIIILARESSELCRSTVGVTSCENELLRRNSPLRINNYKNVLEFSKGNLEEIPSGSFNLVPEVTMLLLSNNQLKKLEPGSFDGLYNLEKLSLYNNKLEVIKKGVLRNCNKVKDLNLGMNKIKEIELEAFVDLLSLSELNLGFNNLETVPEAINNVKSLRTLHLNNNKLKSIASYIFSNLNKLEVLNLNDNEISSLTNNAFGGLSNLKELNLNSNYLNNLNTQNLLSDLRALATIKLSINSFTCQTLNNIINAFDIKGVSVVKGYSKSKDTINGIGCKKN